MQNKNRALVIKYLYFSYIFEIIIQKTKNMIILGGLLKEQEEHNIQNC